MNLDFKTNSRAFTLPEVMVTMAIFSLVVVAVLSVQLFGMRLLRISETKLAGTAGGRMALNHIRDEIRTGKMLMVGNGNDVSFTNLSENAPRAGNALQIYPTADTNSYIRYYWDPADNSLKRYSVPDGSVQTMASFITNQLVFQAEDFQGNVLTTDQNNRVVRLTLEFYRWEYPIASVGEGGMYDYYRLQTRVTRRLIE